MCDAACAGTLDAHALPYLVHNDPQPFSEKRLTLLHAEQVLGIRRSVHHPPPTSLLSPFANEHRSVFAALALMNLDLSRLDGNGYWLQPATVRVLGALFLWRLVRDRVPEEE